MRKFGVIAAAAILTATSVIPVGASPLLNSAPRESAAKLELVPVSHRSGRHRDCHGYADRHFIPGYGRVLHRHYGKRCNVDVLRRSERRDRRDDCIRIGDVKVCV